MKGILPATRELLPRPVMRPTSWPVAAPTATARKIVGNPARADAPDFILIGGKILTADSARPYVQALAGRGDK